MNVIGFLLKTKNSAGTLRSNIPQFYLSVMNARKALSEASTWIDTLNQDIKILNFNA